MRTTIPQIFTR